MNKVFITKFPFATNNAELPYIDGIRLTIAKVSNPDYTYRSFRVESVDECTVECNNGYFVDTDYSTNLGTKFTFKGGKDFIVSNDDAWIDIRPKEAVIRLIDSTSTSLTHSIITADLADFKVKTLNNFNFLSSNLKGDIGNLKYATNMFNLNLGITQVSGDISALSNLTRLTNLFLNGTQVSGDISALSNLTNLNILRLNGTRVSGDISALSNLTRLTNLGLGGTQVSGDISALSNLTNLDGIDVHGLSITGDMSKIPTKVAYIDTSERKITTNFTWTAKGRQNVTLLAMKGAVPFDTVSMDNMLIDQATCTFKPNDGQPWTKTIEVSGTRTSASDAAVTTLQNMGVTITGVTKQA